MAWEATSTLGARKTCKPSRSTLLPQRRVCATQILTPRRKPIEIRSCWSLSFRRGKDISSPAIWATKISAHFSNKNVAQISRQICSHTPSAGTKQSGATCHMAMPQCCYLAKGAKRPSDTTNMLTSLNISVNWSIWSTHLVDTFVAHVTEAILSPKGPVTKCPWPVSSLGSSVQQ